MSKATLRTFIAYVEDLPGVLNRITSLFRRRNYNIVSLTVGRTERPGVSRMTVVLEADEDAARRIEANLYKLVNVLFVEDTSPRRDDGARARPHQGARRPDDPRRGDAPLRGVPRARGRRGPRGARRRDHRRRRTRSTASSTCCGPLGIVEMVRTGVVAMVRSAEATDARPHPAQRAAAAPVARLGRREGGLRDRR